MHGGHQTLLDTQLLMHQHGQRRQAIGGAGRVGNDLLAVQQCVIDTVHHAQVGAVQWMGEQHPWGSGLHMLLDLGAALEVAGALQNQIHAQLRPG